MLSDSRNGFLDYCWIKYNKELLKYYTIEELLTAVAHCSSSGIGVSSNTRDSYFGSHNWRSTSPRSGEVKKILLHFRFYCYPKIYMALVI